MDIYTMIKDYDKLKQLSLSDIEVGMRVNPRQLDEILYTYIILTDRSEDGSLRIVYIGNKDIEKFREFGRNLESVCVVYNTEENLYGLWDE